MITDSGNRTTFESGAVRDMSKGKGRCDLMPLEVVAEWANSDVLRDMAMFTESGGIENKYLYRALDDFQSEAGINREMLILEVSKHFEEGAEKYGELNWQKGIPVNSYIDSAVRHYLKHKSGFEDERHDRAFIWNILCCIWTVNHTQV